MSLPNSIHFTQFLTNFRLETALAPASEDSHSRRLVDAAYEKVVKTMFDSLEAIAKESDQTGDDKEQLNVHIMTIENMHHFYHEVRSHKLLVLEPWIRHSKSQYDSHLNAYIRDVIRRPLGRLLEFFEGVDNAIKTAAPEEVGYQMAYNKAQLRKVLSQFPAKEIKKSLENLYKRVDKHFSEEEGLLQVVWRGIQEEFIQQHEKMEFLIRKCYPETGMQLEFTIQDLLGMMSELARKVHL
ncbi:SEC3-like 1 [Jimgerdemannia flammicorona]|uniref:SEC3-like 1 n=1 Tax=Jimgerdemannia flammicorona TaxID=994334 RepID=A0A433D2J3_9FUNG|nr:SEC3-like 1 [Jimgerdemannia flammicorona]